MAAAAEEAAERMRAAADIVYGSAINAYDRSAAAQELRRMTRFTLAALESGLGSRGSYRGAATAAQIRRLRENPLSGRYGMKFAAHGRI